MASATPRLSQGGSVLVPGLVLGETLPDPQGLIHIVSSVEYGMYFTSDLV
jgi:hypothetical protein